MTTDGIQEWLSKRSRVMLSDQVVIYVGTELREAYLLRDLLADEGISAAVMSQGMSARLGLAASRVQPDVRVLVSQADAPRARQLAVRFQGQRAAELEHEMSEDADNREDDRAAEQPEGGGNLHRVWPRCPECNQPRTTRCPICGTAGADFPAADPPEEISASIHAPAESRACGSASPASRMSARCKSDVETGGWGRTEAGEAFAVSGEQPAPECICPTCDEPFRPVYHRRCQWCDYEFPDGEDCQLPVAGCGDLNIAAIAAIVALVLIALGLSAYVMFLF